MASSGLGRRSFAFALGLALATGSVSLAADPADPADPAESATAVDGGPWIVYRVGNQGLDNAVDLRLVRADGSDDHRIPGSPGPRRFPSWSPDGTRILFESVPADREVSEIWVVAPDGTGQERLRECAGACYGNGGPAWSPDGSTILYDAGEGPTDAHAGDLCFLATMDLATRQEVRLLEHPGCELVDAYPHWSPDGTRVVFQRMRGDGMTEIYTATADGTDEQQVTDWSSAVYPDWSPDGAWITFMSHDECLSECADPWTSTLLVRPDGTDRHALTPRQPGQRDLHPRWLPDGSGVVFSRCYADGACDIRVIDVQAVDGSPLEERVILAGDRHGANRPAWQPMP